MQWLMLQQDIPKDYVIATGRNESIRKFVEITAQNLDGVITKKLLELYGKEKG